MKMNGKNVLVCDCEGTMPLDGKALTKACAAAGGDGDLTIHRYLCRSQIEEFQKHAKDGTPLLVACTQEAPIFLETLDEMAEESGKDAVDAQFVNIRERAGWSKNGSKAAPKIAALLKEATLTIKPTTTVNMNSEGVLLILGRDETAMDAARQLSGRLDVTVILTPGADVAPPNLAEVPVFQGTVKEADGHLGFFNIKVSGFAAAEPSSKASLSFAPGQETGASKCDLILDLRGGDALFSAPEKTDGYFNPDPGNPGLVQKALFDLADMVGEFEKPRYVQYTSGMCTHGRSGVVGCTRCVDLCPASAIADAGDNVAIDPYACGGCGACASVCPTGAAAYLLPSADAISERLRTLFGAYHAAGGKDAVLLIHDTSFGSDLIDIVARAGDGLPAAVLPFAVNQTTQIGLDALLAAGAYGAVKTLLMIDPSRSDEADGLRGEIRLANEIMGGLGYGEDRVTLIDEPDPMAVQSLLYGLKTGPAATPADFKALGNKRGILNIALAHLYKHAPAPVDVLPLSEGSPFGAVEVKDTGCTLCLACVGACPTGALKDNPDTPQLRFAEDACVQCGLCKATCPEKVISLTPRINFKNDTHAHRTLREEAPFDCITCGKPFATQSTIDTMQAKLADHPMFSEPGALDRLKMCDDCRVMDLMDQPNQPMAGPERPKPRTTDDYLRERDELRKQAREDQIARGEIPPDDTDG